MPWHSIVSWFGEYLENKPITDLLLILGIAGYVWSEDRHTKIATDAHQMTREAFRDRDESNERNTDKIISALSGVKMEVKKLPEATATAIIDQKEVKDK